MPIRRLQLGSASSLQAMIGSKHRENHIPKNRKQHHFDLYDIPACFGGAILADIGVLCHFPVFYTISEPFNFCIWSRHYYKCRLPLRFLTLVINRSILSGICTRTVRPIMDRHFSNSLTGIFACCNKLGAIDGEPLFHVVFLANIVPHYGRYRTGNPHCKNRPLSHLKCKLLWKGTAISFFKYVQPLASREVMALFYRRFHRPDFWRFKTPNRLYAPPMFRLFEYLPF